MLEIKPMEPILAKEIPQHNNWIHEIKFDGIRGLLVCHKEAIELYTKKGNNITIKFPEILGFREIFTGKSAIIDGELTVWREDRHSFHDVLVRARSVDLQIK